MLAEHGWLQLAPVEVPLAKGGVVGIVGERGEALGLARALLCQAAVLHGPADLTIAVLTEPEGREDWDWVKWLPHARDAGGAAGRQLAVGTSAGASLAAELADRDEDDPRQVLAVLDSPALIEGRGAAGRALLRAGEKVSGIVIARTSERLPAACTTVVELADEAGEVRLLRPQSGQRIDPLLVAGMSPETARECALALARFEDADLQLAGGALPDHVGLLSLLGIGEPDGAELRGGGRRAPGRSVWWRGSRCPRTARSRSTSSQTALTAWWPARRAPARASCCAAWWRRWPPAHPPMRLTSCSWTTRAARRSASAPRCRTRSGWSPTSTSTSANAPCSRWRPSCATASGSCASAGAADLIEYDRLGAGPRRGAVPRLLVVIDEFATLATSCRTSCRRWSASPSAAAASACTCCWPPSGRRGAVNENIRANTNLRIALRVQTPQDSSDVIDSPGGGEDPAQPARPGAGAPRPVAS